MAKKRRQKGKSATKEQRKLAAIMFTDMVGYSAMTQANEQLALELLREHERILRSVFPKFNGKEIKTIGDAFLVEFPSALDAARCAIDIQQKLHHRNGTVPRARQIQIRIGLHVGDVVYRGKDVYGDGVNIASHIEPLADPEGISISEDVARQIQNKIDLPMVKLGKGELKNIQLPVDFYKIIPPWQKRLPMGGRLGFLLRRRRPRFFASITGILIFLIGASWWMFQMYLSSKYKPASVKENSIAVLPFQNFGGKQDDEYFVDGMTESLITDLAKIPGLFVIARNSAFQYKGKTIDIPKIAKELSVHYVLEGSIQRAGNTLRVNAQLVDAADMFHLWADRFDRQMKDLFSVQDDISKHIIDALKLTLASNDVQKLKTERTSNLEAYDLYLKGLYHSRRRTKLDSDLAIDYFNKTLALDPTYAEAHASLASTLRFRYAFGFERKRAVLDQAKAHAQQALQISPASPEGMVVKGLIQREEGNVFDAVQTLQKDLATYPNDAQCLYYLGNAYRDVGDFEKAVGYHKRALEVEPLYFFNAYNVWEDYWQAKKIDKMIEYGRKAIALDPEHFLSYLIRAYEATMLGKESEAMNMAAKMISVEPDHLDSYGVRADMLGWFGRFDRATKDLEYLLQRDPSSPTGSTYAVPMFVNLKRYSQARGIIETSLKREASPLTIGMDYKALMLIYRGILFRELGQDRAAVESFGKAKASLEANLARFPESVTLGSMYGLSLAHLGKYEDAVRQVQQAAAAQPSNYDLTFNVARVYALKGDKSQVFEWLRRSLRLGKKDVAMMRIDAYFRKLASDKDFLSLLSSPPA